MSYVSTVHGDILISPPLTAVELRAARLGTTSIVPAGQDSLAVRIENENRETDEGVLRITRGTALVVSCRDEFSARSLEHHLRMLVAHWADTHEFSGTLVVSGEDQGDVWRLVVQANEVTRENATLTWPGRADAGPKTWPRSE